MASLFPWVSRHSNWRWPTELRTWAPPVNIALLAGGPPPTPPLPRPLDWPNPPLGYPYPTALRTTTAQHPPWTVWNPSDKGATVTLSGGNLTATSATTAGVVRATASVAAGKWFFSFQASSIPFTNAVRIGIANGSASLSVELGNAANTTALGYRPDGIVAFNAGIAATLAAWTTSDVVDVALDEANQKIWFRVSGGNWNNDVIANQDPANNIGGISVATMTGPHFPASSYRNASGGTVNFGASTFTYSIPSGYAGFDGTASLNTPFAPAPAFLPSDRVPPGYTHPVALRTHIDATRIQLIGQDTIYGAPGQGVPDYDWPNPRGYAFPSDLRGQEPRLNPNLFGGGIEPFSQPDWPNPRGALRGVSLADLSAQNSLVTALATIPAVFPPPGVAAQYDWPNPRGYAHGVSLKTHLDGARVTLFGQDTIYGAPGQGVPNYDWPNPRGYTPGVSLRSWSQSLLQGTLAPFIQRQSDWPNPRGYVPAISLRTHLDPLKLLLRGQDKIYGAPGQGVPNYDWPVPKGYVPAIGLRSWSQNLLQSTIAPIAPKPGSQTDWPNPRGYAYPVSLRTTINPRILPPPTNWVTPPDSAGVWTDALGASGIWTTQPEAV